MLCISGAFTVGVALALHFLSSMHIDFAPTLTLPTAFYIFLSVAGGIGAWLTMLVVTKNISATYAAIGEISYPIFVALFSYFFFRNRDLDWSMALGGLLIMVGSVIVITDKIKIGG